MIQAKKIDRGLKKHGFGGLSDPNLFDQIATVISGRSEKDMHFRFRSLLLSAEPEKRKLAYDSIAPKLRYRALPLEDYIIQGGSMAEEKQLPHYDTDTMTITEWKPQEIETEAYKEMKRNELLPQEEAFVAELEERAARAIAVDLREQNAKGQLYLVCRKCTREQRWRGKRRDHMLKLAKQEGWYVSDGEVLCIFCKPRIQ